MVVTDQLPAAILLDECLWHQDLLDGRPARRDGRGKLRIVLPIETS
jgi:hypothetical protein